MPSDRLSFLRTSYSEGVEDEGARATRLAGETAVAEVRARAVPAAVFLSPLMRALIDFFQAGVSISRGILEDASREEPTDFAVDSTAPTSRAVEVKAGGDSPALIVHAWTRGSTTSV